MTEYQEEAQPLAFGNRPVRMVCPFCLQQTKSEVVLKPQYATIIVCVIVFMVLPNILNIIAIVFVFQLTSVKKHRCGLCQRQLGTDGKFLHYFQDSVYSYDLGRSGLIFSKKILTNILLTILLFGLIAYKSSHHFQEITYIDKSWSQFYQECMAQTSANAKCQNDYVGKTVKNWKGYIIGVKDHREMPMVRFTDFYILLYMRMDPDGKIQGDVKLGFDHLMADHFEFQLDHLHHGDGVLFNGTFLNTGTAHDIGNASKLPHLHVTGMRLTGETKKELPMVEIEPGVKIKAKANP